MKVQYFLNEQWIDIDQLGENNFFGDLDGYNESTKKVFFRILNEAGDQQRNNVMMRLIEKYNLLDFPLVKNENRVMVNGGNQKIDSKVFYSLKKNDDPVAMEGIEVIPDNNGIFLIGDLEQDTGTLNFSVTIETEKQILTDIGETLNISGIYFRFSSSTL